MMMMRVLPLFLLVALLLSSTAIASSSSSSDTNTNNDDDDIDNDNDNSIPSISIGFDVAQKPVRMPLIGAGTWQYNDTIAYQSVCQAFAAGYTFVDTAFAYGNQQGVGRAIRDCWQGSREDLFVMTKIPGGLNATLVHAAHQQNLILLGLDYVDHLMTHFPADWKQTRASPKLRQEEWLALEKIYYTGQARSIGVSHYCSHHLDDILSIATVRPSVNQVEYHVGSQDVDHVIDKCQQEGIAFMSFSPLCGPCEYDPVDSLIHGTLVTEIGAKYGKSGSQVSLRYIVQQALMVERRRHAAAAAAAGNTTNNNNNNNHHHHSASSSSMSSSSMSSVIPKSNNAEHIQSNREIFDFMLSDEDMERLHAATKPPPQTGDCDVP